MIAKTAKDLLLVLALCSPWPAALAGLACYVPVAMPAGDTGDHGFPCPGPQCPCPCAAPLICGPHGGCSSPCVTPEDCGGPSGETCLGGLCGVLCRPGGADDCAAIGMRGGACLTIQGVDVCGYPPAELAPEGVDESGPPIP